MVSRPSLPRLFVVLAAVFLLGAGLGSSAEPKPADLIEKADRLFDEKNYAHAAELYGKLLEPDADAKLADRANQRFIACKLRLQLFGEALAAAEANVKRQEGGVGLARAHRFAGNLYLLVPHWGTRAGGTFHRGKWAQGIQVRSGRHDKLRSVRHLEQARELYARLDGDAAALEGLPKKERARFHEERIECLFDLAGAATRFGIYENQWIYWYGFWAERDDFAAETAGEDDFDEYYGQWQRQRKRPVGLRTGADDRPVFATRPPAYAKGLDDDQKLLFLLNEIRELDRTPNRRYRALSYYRQAMLARTRFGVERLNAYGGVYWANGIFPLKEEIETIKPWTLADDQAIVLAGGRVRTVTLPPQWNALALLRAAIRKHPKSGVSAQAGYAVGLIYQSRQRYQAALVEYTALQKQHPKSKWAVNAAIQVVRIRQPQAGIAKTGVQLSGEPAAIQLSHRNVKKVWFTARKIDHRTFLKGVRDQKIKEGKGLPNFWSVRRWHSFFVHPSSGSGVLPGLVDRTLGKEIARWTEAVADDGTHRYSRMTTRIPLQAPGAYLVTAYVTEPPDDAAEKTGRKAVALGQSRAVLSLSDLALVEKRVKNGNLYFVCNARTGAPVADAAVDVVEVWSTYNQKHKRSEYHKARHRVRTGADGLAVVERPASRGAQLHALVEAEGPDGATRLAWSGMSYWSHYRPSVMRSGLFAYCMTDRPVYRPDQTVRFKVWLRQMTNGAYANRPGRSAVATIYDPRGNKVHRVTGTLDAFGGFDGSFTLGDEPPLGMYRFHVAGASVVGGQRFRVEEYKKPEFEVTVEPGKKHAKLGDTIKALVKARYYFGAPVIEATVKYKVFREEYTHAHYFPGPWDWLYGPGYGWAWYGYDWFPWWGRLRSCWLPPSWWWGFSGYQPRKPVRELVQQGEAPISKDGTLEVAIDTKPALRDHPDRDHRYVVEAEVRDASRRVITGRGAVKVTRQSYYAFLQAGRGYYRPGEEISLQLRCLTPGGQPVETEGVVTVSSVRFGGPDNAQIEQTELKRWTASTDAEGRLPIKLRHERSGQLQVRFQAPDAWGGTVEGYAVLWVVGDDFDGSLQRFNDLEIITDKRTYQPGEVAHVMINTKQAGSHVLFSDDVDSNHLLSWRVLHLTKRHTLVDVTIGKDHRPNLFIEATTVAGGRVHQQARRICVPPADGLLKITVKTDKAEYKPGEEVEVEITARGPDGAPAQAQVVLSAFDRSLLYIQPELTPPVAGFFHGRLRHHSQKMTTNLLEQLTAWSNFQRPFQALYPIPPSWWGVWGPSVRDWRSVADRDLLRLDGRLGEAEAGLPSSGMGYGDRGRFAKEELATAAAPSSRAGVAVALDRSEEVRGGEGGDRLNQPKQPGSDPAAGLVAAQVRSHFADTATWQTALATDKNGKAQARFRMPENLTTWKLNAWGMTIGTRVGQATTSAVTTKNLLVRLQAPRFFMERDQVVLSANVHNYLDNHKKTRVSLDLPAELLELLPGTPATLDVNVPAGGERRVDWRVRVLREGRAQVTVKALTDEESDATRMAFPVLVHGMTKQVATTGSLRPDDPDVSLVIDLDVPKARRAELTRLEVQLAPSLVGAMLDALPYCLYYPYGCTEQTVSRFLPAVLTLKTLQNLGIDLKTLKKIRGRMAEIRRLEKGERRSVYADSPIFDPAELQALLKKGRARIANMQNTDGGWGWWNESGSTPYLTAYVLYALSSARDCDVAIEKRLLRGGARYLRSWEQREMAKTHWRPNARHAFYAYALSLQKLRAAIKPGKKDERPGDLVERLWIGRDKLNLYGKALLALTMANLQDEKRARTVLENILQYKVENAKTEVAHFRTPSAGWWYWWNSDIETNAWILRAICRLDPKNDVAPRLVKWLLQNRRNGYYWRSTRDTTLCVAAMSDFVSASGEGEPDYTLRIELDDGAISKEIRITKKNFFTFDNRFVIEGAALTAGHHTLTLTKQGRGALYFNTYLRYFTKEEGIKAAGHELHVERTYFRLEKIAHTVSVEGAKGQPLKERRLRYRRVPLAEGATVKSGDLIQTELRVKADNDYTYLALEDMKPAGFEPVNVRSGGKGQEGFLSYMELRDEKVVFFLRSLSEGEHLLRYRMRAEVPGVFHALPTTLYGMYVPELRANSAEQTIRIVD